MEKTIFLKNGQEAQLIQKINNESFLVVPMVICSDYDGEEFVEPGERIVVDNIFRSAPMGLINEEYQVVKDDIVKSKQKLSGIRSELIGAQKKLNEVTLQKTNVGKMVYNRSELKNAKRITVFEIHKLLPVEMSETNKKNLKISIEFSVIDGEEKSWSYNWYGDDWSSSNRIDPDYGFIIDATDEEIVEIIKRRAINKPPDYFRAYSLSRVPDEYLPFPLLSLKMQYLKDERDKKIEKLENGIKTSRKALKELKAQ